MFSRIIGFTGKVEQFNIYSFKYPNAVHNKWGTLCKHPHCSPVFASFWQRNAYFQQSWWKWLNEDPTVYCDWSHNEDSRSVGAGMGNSPRVDWAERAGRGRRRSLWVEGVEEDGCREEEELSPARLLAPPQESYSFFVHSVH